MSFVIEIKFRVEDEVGHHLFIRKHQTRVIDTTRPKNRTVLVCNIPPWCPTSQIKRLFSLYGSIVSTEFQLRPGKADESDDLDQKELEDKFKVAYIVFAKEQSIANLKTASENGDKMVVSTIENPVITGLESYCASYNQSFPNIKKLQNEINTWMSDFEESNAEQKVESTEEGWTAVKGKGTTRRTEEDQNEMKMKAAKKRKKGQLLNFYQFQIRESKKQKIIELREKFEADKKKVDRMKQDRKFKPMTS